MAVLSGRTGQGIGRKMMLEAEEWAKNIGFNSFDLKASSERAIKFYEEKCDFTAKKTLETNGNENELRRLKKIFSFEPMHFNYLHDIGF